MSNRFVTCFAGLLFTFVALSGNRAAGDTHVYDWDNPLGGDYLDGDNWLVDGGPGTGVPGSDDLAGFGINEQYRVYFTGDALTFSVFVEKGDVLLDLQGHTALFDGFGSHATFGRCHATFIDGTISSRWVAVAGSHEDYWPDLTIAGGAVLATDDLKVGSDSSAGELIIKTGGELLVHQEAKIGEEVDCDGSVLVTGSGSLSITTYPVSIVTP